MKYKYALAFLDMAERFGQTSTAERLKVGALLVNHKGFPVAVGCNGTPAGWKHNYCEDPETGFTLPVVRHAERAALDKLRNSSEKAENCIMFISHAPCLNCAIEMVDAGLSEVWYKHPYFKEGVEYREGIDYLKSRGVIVTNPI
ncbi:hypothetical protein [Ralstonia phage RSP15]|uniref:hypothetical protein n=1 Tax=Ralstonia phage RSP15 TaxID=1785960 RepID=UPI00074D3A51|nr:hypothetical protein BH754_gp089 [Ralstonia phage RSP15]BAU40047.1 hypothetical protein [Ralstonia phage RSP15]